MIVGTMQRGEREWGFYGKSWLSIVGRNKAYYKQPTQANRRCATCTLNIPVICNLEDVSYTLI